MPVAARLQPPPSVSGSSAASPPKPPRLQPTAPAHAQELASLFQDVCQLVSLPDAPAGAPSFGCACCAPFDGCKPGDAPAEVAQQAYFPAAAVRGNFTRVGAEEQAMPMDGCEPHSENYGGLLLLERQGPSFALERYISGLNAARCWSMHRDDGRDALLCERDDVHQGTADQQLFEVDLTLSDEQLLVAPPLLAVTDDEMSGCWSAKGTAVSSTVMKPPQLSQRGGRTQLTVELDVRRGRVSAAYLARCKALEAAADVDGPPAKSLPRPRQLLAGKTERLVFRFDGSKLVGSDVRPPARR